jgi:ribosomal protein S18 acetylase RimI-like enzyme
MADVTVRPAGPADVSDILRIAEAGWKAAYEGIIAQETIDAAMEEWYDSDGTRDLVERDDVGYFVVVEDGTEDVVGYVSGGPGESGDVAKLGAIYTHPDRWGEGIGTALLDRFESFCREEGFDAVEFSVLAGNDVGASFYRKHGYEVVDESESDLFGEPVEEYQFRGELE